MVTDIMNAYDAEMLGRVLDGQATPVERRKVISNLADRDFKECFLVGLRAAIIYSDKNNEYETVE